MQPQLKLGVGGKSRCWRQCGRDA